MAAHAGFDDEDDVDMILRESPMQIPSDDPLSTTPTPSSSPGRDMLSPTHAEQDLDDLDHDYEALRMRHSSDEDDDFERVEVETHRLQLANALAQLPKKRQNEDDEDYRQRPTDSGFDYLYDSPVSSPTAAASSTALVVATGPAPIGPMNQPSSSYAKSYTARTRNPFTGLSNQGATCYMNSLLQTMFMTPELRLGLYRSSFDEALDEEAAEDSIPFQLQKLFATLQMTAQDAISTKALTKSFGWTGADVFQQHDVQELCRVLFDALEKSFKGTVNETLVNDLYQGMMKDYVQCCTCGYESSRNDEFLDLSLVIQPFGSTEKMKSIEEAIELFLKPELLNGDNQWNCDRCKTKRDAIKGLKFSKLPYLLSLQLKRFDYDYMTDSRIKLHDRVVFPKYLDMNSYLHSEEAGGNAVKGSIARKMSMERHELERNATGHETTAESRVQRMSSMDETQPALFGAAIDGMTTSQVEETWRANFDVDQLIQRSGPYVYELYSVLIHSGSALGGHYYAYIKSLETGKWYDFNDSSVSELSESDVQKAWGGNSSGGGYGGYSSRISYSTCAYMLMYRLINKEKNVQHVGTEQIPASLVRHLREEEERLKRQELERIEMSKKIQLKFYMKTLNHRLKAAEGSSSSSPHKMEKSLYVYTTASLKETLILAHQAFAADFPTMPAIENVRFRMYNDYTGILSDTFEGKEDKSLKELQMYSSYQLFLEVKRPDEEWEPYDSTKLQLFLRRFQEEEQDTARSDELSARHLQLDESATIQTLLDAIRTKFAISSPDKKIRLVQKAATSYTSTAPVKILNRDDSASIVNRRLRYDLHLVNGSDVYFEECDDLAAPSPAEAYFEREVNTITIHFYYQENPRESLRIDRRETVRVLKQRIADRVNLPMDGFKLLRGSHRAGIEIKSIDTTLLKLSIGNENGMYVLEGTPLYTGEYMFRLLLHKPAKNGKPATTTTSSADSNLVVVGKTDSEDDLFDLDEIVIRTNNEESELVYVGMIKVGEDMQVEAIRAVVWQTLKEKGHIDSATVTPSHLRLRDLQTTTLTRVLTDGRTLKEASSAPVYENRGLGVQILTQPERLEPGHRIVQVVYVDRYKWRFCKRRRKELVLHRVDDNSSVDDELEADRRPVSPVDPLNTYVAEEIASALAIPLDRMRFAVFSALERDTFDICELYKTNFTSWALCMQTMSVERRGSYEMLAFVVDEDEPIGSFSARERMHIQDFLVRKREEASRSIDRSSSSYSGYSSYRKPKETGIVIRTKSKSSEKGQKGGSTASSTGDRSTNGGGVTIRSPASSTSARRDDRTKTTGASSDTDQEDDDVDDVDPAYVKAEPMDVDEIDIYA